ncbi:tRNA epoxyqueuosine(34) reductase QueG [bacterium]|nr:tRNA epoxyqueuosine(34) reductase QueG [bacterium]
MPGSSETQNAPPLSKIELRERIRRQGLELGFDAIGFAPAVAPPGYPDMLDWLEMGQNAGMAYMERQAQARAHPRGVFEPVATVIVAVLNYKPETSSKPGPGDESIASKRTCGHVAAYAQGRDYHFIFWERLDKLLAAIQADLPDVRGRAVADSAPLMERDFARLAGLGWFGKNTCLIHKSIGSFTLLGALLIDLELPPDAPFEADHCGTCTRCLDACPTQAFEGPYRLDARKCISYWTIEHKGHLPDEAADDLHGWAFGCDICQQVCPWNRKPPAASDAEIRGDGRFHEPDLLDWLEMEPAEMKRLIKGTALERSKRAGLVRNACHVLAGNGASESLPALNRLAESDPDEVVRHAAARAAARLQSNSK